MLVLFLLGKSHGRRSLVGCSPWSREGWTRLRDFTFTFRFHALEKEMATHSSVLAWGIPGTGEPVGLPSMGRTELDTTEATQQQRQQQSFSQIQGNCLTVALKFEILDRLTFHFVASSFGVQTLFSFMQSYLYIYVFVACAFDVVSIQLLPRAMS